MTETPGSDADGDGAGTAASGAEATPDGGPAETVDPETVSHVADLARVDLDEEELEAFAAQFAEILDYFETLDEVPETDAEADLANVMRPDEVRDGLSQEEALRNAPETEDGHFKGPRVS